MARTKPDTTETIIRIPLADLSLSPLNSRQSVPDADVDAMADSIIAVGLLQNLIGHRNADGAVQIVGGGKRLRAMQKLAQEGFTPVAALAFDPVPVRVTDDADLAVAMSGAENEARTGLHPADAITAYGAMQARGASVQDIARAYAATEGAVRRYLALAVLPAPVIDSLRDGRITFDQAKALTLADTYARAIEMLDSIEGRDVNPNMIRRELTTGRVPATDPRAIAVGLPAYLAAGGTCTPDLFEDTAYLDDVPLLEKMVDARAQAIIADLTQDQGWKWAEYRPQWRTWEGVRGAVELDRTKTTLPPGDQARLDHLSDFARNADEDLTEDEYAELASLRDRQRGDWPDTDRATAGCIVFWGNKGLDISRGWQRAADKPKAVETVTHDDGTVTTRALPAADKGNSASLSADLGRIRLLALQNAALADPGLMVDLLAWQMTHDCYTWQRPLDVTPNPQTIRPEKPDGTIIPTRLTTWAESKGAFNADSFADWRDGNRDARLELLGTALACTLREGEAGPLLISLLQPQVRTVWAPTAAGYFSRITAPQMDAIWAQLVPDDAGLDQPPFTTMKKGDKAKRLDALFNDASVRESLGLSRAQNAAIDTWLPSELLMTAAIDETARQEDAA
jgi:ParB family transcriptional regulator, chromosome partitioning protein